jgi:hypothetical protein
MNVSILGIIAVVAIFTTQGKQKKNPPLKSIPFSLEHPEILFNINIVNL